jgi:hypothetical protein
MKLLFALVAALALSACKDRGACMQSHYQTSGYFQPQYMTLCNGSSCTQQLLGMDWQDTSGNVCDQWQYPNGKPEK